MRVEKRKLADGKYYYSFVYWNGKKRVRLKKSEHPHFVDYEKALEWSKSKEAEINSVKSRIQKRLEWKTQYYNFSKLSDQYLVYCKKAQTNSWKNTALYLEHYVIPFFLEIKNSNNPNNWSLFFEDFRIWLVEKALTIRTPQRNISYSTKNHCVKTLNTFLDYLKRNNKVDPSNIYKMTGFGKEKLNNRSADHLISNEEFKAIYSHLKELDSEVATFFQTAYWTGMRFNEIYGLSLDDLFVGKIEDNVLGEALEDHNIEYYGYIVLESQPKSKTRKRLKAGAIERKPLKGKKSISEKNNRIIPIVEKSLFNNLVKLYKTQQRKFECKEFGKNPKDYLLFESMNTSTANRLLKKAYSKTQFIPKSYHCCRHTRATELVGRTRDFVLAQMWLGHARQETTLRYTHIYQQSVRAVRKKEQNIEFIE